MAPFVRKLVGWLLFVVLVTAQRGGGGRRQCTCTEDADPSQARYEQDATTSSQLTIRTMGIPNHVFHTGRERTNPNVVCPRPSSVTLPKLPTRSGTFSPTPLVGCKNVDPIYVTSVCVNKSLV